MPHTSGSSSRRMRIPEPVQLIYLGPPEDSTSTSEPTMPVWPPLPSIKIAFQPGEDSHSDIFDLCLNPTPEQCKAATPEEIESLSNEAINPEWKKETMKAWRRWATFCLEEVDISWLNSAHREAVRAGLRKTPAEFDRRQAIVRLRAQAAPEGEIMALEYALCREETGEVPLAGEWKSLPKGAYSEEFVRCTVNLLRKDTGKRLIRREEWRLVMRDGEREGEEAGMEK